MLLIFMSYLCHCNFQPSLKKIKHKKPNPQTGKKIKQTNKQTKKKKKKKKTTTKKQTKEKNEKKTKKVFVEKKNLYLMTE